MGRSTLGPKLGILLELSSKEGSGCADDLVARMARRTLGALSVPATALHLALKYLIKDGIVLKSSPRSIKSRSKPVYIYTLTSEGRALAESHRDALSGWTNLKVGAKRLRTPVRVTTTL